MAEREGMDWAATAELDEAQIEARLCLKTMATGQRTPPNCDRIHRKLRRKGVTPQLSREEYVEAHAAATTFRHVP